MAETVPAPATSPVAETVPATVVECRAAPAALARSTVPSGMTWVALRPDRALAVVLGDAPRHTVRELEDANPEVLVVDVSPGWVAFVVTSPPASSLAVAPAGHAAQSPGPWAGAVAGVPAVVMPVDGGTAILVGASYARYLASQLDRGALSVLPRVAAEPHAAQTVA